MGDSSITQSTVYSGFKTHFSATGKNNQLNVLEAVRDRHRDAHVTTIDTSRANLLEFAAAGHAEATLLHGTDEHNIPRYYTPPTTRLFNEEGALGDDVQFGLYDYAFHNERFQVCVVEWRQEWRTIQKQYIVSDKSAADDGIHSAAADKLIKAAGKWTSELHEEIYVFDAGEWTKNKTLWEAVQSASWDDVILDPALKKTIIADVQDFFDSRAVYEEHSVPWKRGIIFHGTPGCGKTVSIKALINTLQSRDVASLYVKSFQCRLGPQYSIREIFTKARAMAPCMLVFEDLDSLVVDKVRSYFLNEVDGLENNHGILLVGSTNHLERLDPGISKRPSRFDRKYQYSLPAEKERILYCQYWRAKLLKSSAKMSDLFEEEICTVVAQLTEGFSFAYLKELFVQALLAIMGGRGEDDEDEVDVAASGLRGVDNSAKLVKEGEAVSTEDTREDPAPARAMPDVSIPPHLEQNSLMRVLFKQSKALWKEMDNSGNSDEVRGRGKIAGSRRGSESSDDCGC